MNAIFFLHALLSAAAAVVFADVLVQPGQLLAPVQSWLRAWYRKPYRPTVYLRNPGWPEYHPEFVRGKGAETSKELDEQIWWQPLWGCAKCVAGWWCLVAYLVHYPGPVYCWWAHVYFVATGILLALLLQKLVAWTR